jgi:hypothetical protein
MSARTLLAATIVLASCGGGSDDASPIDTATIDTATIDTATIDTVSPAGRAAPPSSAAGIERIDEPATVTTTAERVDDALRITWIGGSEIDLEDRSLPDAVAARAPTAGDRELHVFADTKIAPLPHEVAERVERAAERNADGLVVILNPSWLSWDGHTECSGIAAPHEFYACVLTPRPTTDVDALRADVEALIDTIVATGLPAYVYVIPHSAESLADPQLAPLLATAEAQFAEMNPAIDRIEFIDRIISRDLEPLREGVEFNDMVHPSELGIQRLADVFADEFTRFFGAHPPT